MAKEQLGWYVAEQWHSVNPCNTGLAIFNVYTKEGRGLQNVCILVSMMIMHKPMYLISFLASPTVMFSSWNISILSQQNRCPKTYGTPPPPPHASWLGNWTPCVRARVRTSSVHASQGQQFQGSLLTGVTGSDVFLAAPSWPPPNPRPCPPSPLRLQLKCVTTRLCEGNKTEGSVLIVLYDSETPWSECCSPELCARVAAFRASPLHGKENGEISK